MQAHDCNIWEVKAGVSLVYISEVVSRNKKQTTIKKKNKKKPKSNVGNWSWVWWYLPVTPSTQCVETEELKFWVSLGYLVRFLI